LNQNTFTHPEAIVRSMICNIRSLEQVIEDEGEFYFKHPVCQDRAIGCFNDSFLKDSWTALSAEPQRIRVTEHGKTQGGAYMDTNTTSQAILSAVQTGGEMITTAIVGLWQRDEMLFLAVVVILLQVAWILRLRFRLHRIQRQLRKGGTQNVQKRQETRVNDTVAFVP
jgi:hypothetical protein